MSYKKTPIRSNRLKINNSTQGETLELKLERMIAGKEPITNGAPIIYTDRKDGVKPEHDVRTDRFEMAIDAQDKMSKAVHAKRDAFAKSKNKKDGKPESTDGTSKADTK